MSGGLAEGTTMTTDDYYAACRHIHAVLRAIAEKTYVMARAQALIRAIPIS